MKQLDEQSENSGANNPQATEVLQALTQDIQNLRQTLLFQLSQDIERLQREKAYLRSDIETLKNQRQQQIIQQQELVQQIAPDLANQLHQIVRSRLDQLGATPTYRKRRKNKRGITANDYNENANRVIRSLDTTIKTTFKTLQQDVSSYESSLSQQLSQMHSLEQQGEAILETLVSRLKKELEIETTIEQPNASSSDETANAQPLKQLITEPFKPAKLSEKTKQSLKVGLGFCLVFASSLLLAFQNIVIPILFNKSSIFGLVEWGGLIVPSLGNALLILWLRMLVVVPSLAILTTVLYPAIWQDIRQFLQSKDLPLFINVVSSSFFLFLSQVLVYVALGTIVPGVAISIFFVYPILTMLLTWLMFGIRPTRFSNLLMFSVLIGFVLLTLVGGSVKFAGVGVTAAAGSAIAFALYVMLAQTSGRKLHPMPLSWINFALILVFASLGLVAPLPEAWHPQILPNLFPGIVLGSLVLAGTTIISFICNNIGIKMIDAARASVLGAIVPSLTALLALLVIQSTMQFEQILGMLLVTLGIAALSLERLRRQRQMAQANGRS